MQMRTLTNRLHCLTLHGVRISHKTCWTFVKLRTQDGRMGYGEATLTGREDLLEAAAQTLAPLALAASLDRPGEFAVANAPADLPHAAMVCAIDQALWDLHAQNRQLSLAQVLGVKREQIPIYANINRRTEQRTPEGFAASAAVAIAAGFTAFKIAPFDEVNTALCAQGQGLKAMQPGLDRIAAVRAAVGPKARLMVDCHWRCDEATALKLNLALAALGVYWIECPLPEIEANIPALTRLRQHANRLGMRQAGLEESIGWEQFRPYCEAGAYDVVMPDIKYAGGIAEMLRIAQACAQLKVQISPHNPSGPVCHAVSLQLACVLDSFDMLEMQFDESPLFDSLAGAPFAAIQNGFTVPPSGAGLGVHLDATLLQAHADRIVRVWEA